ncbi:MAG: ATP-binding protein [Fusobacterium sp.]|nr:hybrid sensor histidine kinase/response regulator [Fusobacterium sp.]MDO5788313.1 ATP-binding protein [Fusobacterium sp.]
MKERLRRYIKKRAIFGLTILLFFMILSIFSLLIVREKILDNVQLMGKQVSEQLLIKENEKIGNYEMFVRTAGIWLNDQIEKHKSQDELRDWMKEYTDYINQELNTKKVEVYAAIDKKIIGATYWEGDESFDVDKAEWYNLALLANGKVVYTDTYKDIRTGESSFTVAKKINEKNDVLAVDIYLDELSEPGFYKDLPSGSSYFLCDAKGNIVYSIHRNKNSEIEINRYIQKVIYEILEGKHDVADSFTIDLEGKKRGVYYSASKNGWISILTIPYTTLLIEVEKLYYFYIGGFVLLILIGIVSYYREVCLNKKIEETNEAVRVLGNSYYAIYRVDFKKERYFMLKGSGYMQELLSRAGNYQIFIETLIEVIEPEAREEFRKGFSLESIRDLVKRRVKDFGGDFKRKFGSEYRWVNVRILYDESLSTSEVILCFKEINDEKRQQLEHIELLKDSLRTMEKNMESRNIFFSNMSHDMRTPLNGIIGLSELAKLHIGNSSEVAKYLDKINSSSKQLLNLINDILDLSKADFGKYELNREEFSLKESIEESLILFEVDAKKMEKDFEVIYKIENNRVIGDFNKIRQILNNIISNAFKYTRVGDKITLTVEEIKREKYSNFRFEVKDTGYGMTEEFLGKIFLPFERETRFGAKGIKGTGLGMPIVKNLVTQLEGEIAITSKIEKGTTVSIIIPLEISKERVEEKTRENNELETSLVGRTILLAEDNEINMEIATEFLQMKGINIIQAWNGLEAVEKFEASKVGSIDIILMDMQMPELDGCEAAKRIRNLGRSDAKSIPIVAVTANAFPEDISATTLAGMNGHISKPIDFNILEKKLKEYLKRK